MLGHRLTSLTAGSPESRADQASGPVVDGIIVSRMHLDLPKRIQSNGIPLRIGAGLASFVGASRSLVA